jgi:hypothetical protein
MSSDNVHAASGTSLSPPSGEELAAVIAAAEVAWPRPVVAAEPDDGQPAWRFSGRWWARPVAARRQRPWVG